jgi:inositol-hexakisphosphate 5-kinase
VNLQRLNSYNRYIGVLNVTFQKQSRRKSVVKRDEGSAMDRKRTGEKSTNGAQDEMGGRDRVEDEAIEQETSQEESRRVFSQSLRGSQIPIPTVTFDNNWHILPRNLLQPTPPALPTPGRSRSISTDVPQASDTLEKGVLRRPTLDDRHADSWGATMVNKRLRNEVFNDAFLKQPISVQRHQRAHQRSLPRRTIQQVLRPSISDSRLMRSEDAEEEVIMENNAMPSPRQSLPEFGLTQSDLGPARNGSSLEPGDITDVHDVTGTSAPEPETLAENPVVAAKKKRRYSGSGLRRKPGDVTESRGNLKYFEEADDAGYKGDGEDGSRPESRTGTPTNGHPKPTMGLATGNGTVPGTLSDHVSSVPSEATGPVTQFKKIERPVNPKEAQTQRDSRVEYFLLLEDLTAGMKRPCIMDLKMGTRQYGVDANPKKQKSQQGKCARTTSRELGVRVCGLQVWDGRTQGYVFKDKYYGRDLKAGHEFQTALTRFLYDGVDYSSVLRHIPTILQKLSQLEVIVGRLDGYRFYAASLLMFYDGDTSSDPLDYDTAIDDSTTDFATDTEETSALKEMKRMSKNKREIDFKIADFANSVTAGDLARNKPCPPQHPKEPDRGFLRGLRTLRRYFLRIQRDVRLELGLDPLGRNGHVDVDLNPTDDEGEVSQ